MNIICTGVSCSGRRELMGDFQAFCVQKELNIGFFNVGDFIHRIAAKAGVHFTEKVLDADPVVLSLARRNAFYEIAQCAKAYEHAIIGLHTCFRWRGILIEGFSFEDIEILPPDLFINVVDNISDISARMQKTIQWAAVGKGTLNVWLDEEELLTRQLANFAKKRHYTITAQQEPDNFYELLFSRKPKFYLSYPIMMLEDTPEKIQKIRELGEKLRHSFIVFDPLSIQDMELIGSAENRGEGKQSPPTTIGEVDQYVDVVEQIKTRTISRDYQFIHQSDFMVVIYPTDKLSPGVLSEMNYAAHHNKPVYAVYTGARSIFFEKLCERIFDTFEELVDFLNKTYRTPEG